MASFGAIMREECYCASCASERGVLLCVSHGSAVLGILPKELH